MMAADVCSIFVYGTLQRGEEREPCWPRPPLVIEAAEVSAELYHLGDYPAMIPGHDRVAGELWRLRPEDLAVTLHVLDEIECCGQGGVDLYLRQVVVCRTSHDEAQAFTYMLADEAIAKAGERVLPGADGRCRWHRYR